MTKLIPAALLMLLLPTVLPAIACTPPTAPAEGEGEGEAGEGEGEGEGELGEGEGEGEGEPGEGEGEPSCTSDDDCVLGNICLDGACTPGCDEDRDCPVGQLCDVAAPEHGACVLCLTADDCEDGEVCFAGACTTTCAEDDDCVDGVCDTDDEVCVGCIDDDDCEIGSVCEAATCLFGCHEDRDCADDEICDLSAVSAENPLGTCVEGCSTTPSDTCPLGTHCEDTQCQLGCAGDDTRCGDDHICVNDTCRVACVDGDDCPDNDTCIDGACVDGCQIDADCGSGVCTGSAGNPGACVECLEDDDCGLGSVCDEPAQTCRFECQGGGDFCLTGVCDVESDLCVDCLVDEDCADGESCDVVSRTCLGPPLGDTVCNECTVDADCGDGNLCLLLSVGPGVFESVCGLDCGAGQACPSGFACELVSDADDVVVGQQCVPSSSVVEAPTCDAYRDAVGEALCIVAAGAFCGIDAGGAGDGVCLPEQADDAQGVCTLPCGVDGDCPAAFTCEAVNFPDFPVDSACVPG